MGAKMLLRGRLLNGVGFALLILTGCGGADTMQTAKVSGMVTLDGKAVTGGSLTLQPQSGGKSGLVGKSASGEVKPDGSFQLTTYSPGDGAVIGKHQVVYSPPGVATPEVPEGAHAEPQKVPYQGATPKQTEVEVKAGENKLTIELQAASPG